MQRTGCNSTQGGWESRRAHNTVDGQDPLRNDKEKDGAQMDAFHMVWVEWDFALVRLIVGGLGLMLMWG